MHSSYGTVRHHGQRPQTESDRCSWNHEVLPSQWSRLRCTQCQVRHRWLLHMRQEQERSEEHTSELQSRFDLVCRLLLEKKKLVILDYISHVSLNHTH